MPIEAGDVVLIRLTDDHTFLVVAHAGKKIQTHRGIVNLDDVIGREYGSWAPTTREPTLLLRPTLEEMIMKVKRQTTIIYPKDAGMILLKLGLGPGSQVLEVGTGSGALTLALAHSVRPGGRVYSYDLREDFLALSRENVERVGLSDHVEFFRRDGQGQLFRHKSLDAAVLDVPEPWKEIEPLREALRPGARLASLNPTYNQVEQMVETLRRSGFVLVETMEILYRRLQVLEGRTRPLQHMVGHTGFLTFAACAGAPPAL
ncbi:MAG: tRNA (adenine-N1)-methyltransferase [Acidobacteria bacterium]|nr:tRNA (adenine-N1)-methyltransferase [Acidobacteriota bacterium]